MRHFLSTTATLGIAFGALLQPSGAQAPGGDRSVAVHCGTLLTGDGRTVLHDVWLLVADGKVRDIGKDAPPTGIRVIDAGDKVVMPGIVAVDSDLSGATDSAYQVAPDALAVDAFDFERRLRAELEGGVTTVYLSPGRKRLVSGQGAVIKTAGLDIVERVLADSACLRIDLGDDAVRAPRVFEPTPHPTSDDPLRPSRIQTPTARISVLAELRALFREAAEGGTGGEGPAQFRYDEAAFQAVVGNRLPLRAGAFLSQDIRRALLLQKELGARMVLEDPEQIGPVAATAAAQGVPATFRVPVRFGLANPGGENRLDERPRPDPEAPAKAAAAGMKIGLAPANGVSFRDYLMAIAIAVGHGLPREAALRAVGRDAAEILGVDDRVGSLQPGKDADFIVLSGDPLAVGSMVESTWIDGVEVFHRHTDGTDKVLAVRCGRILDGNGRVYRNGVILAQNGRIKAVGEDLAIPYGAELIDLGDAVMTPGFIDTFSHLGLAGDGTNVPPGTPQGRVDDAVSHDDPMFRPALEAGLTTLLVGGKDSGAPVGSRLAALKTGAANHDAMIVNPTAGLRMTHDAIGPGATKGIAAQIAGAKAYAKKWADYEKALEAWKNGETPAKKAPAAEPKTEAKQPDKATGADPVAGTWEADFEVRDGVRIQAVLRLDRKGTTVTGTLTMSFAGRTGRSHPIENGRFEDGKLTFEFPGMRPDGPKATFEGTVSGDTMTGKLTLPPLGEKEVTARRTSKETPKTEPTPAPKRPRKPSEKGKPKPPPVQENLEPLRAAIEGRGAVVVTCRRAAAIEAVVSLLEKEKIPYVLNQADDLLDDPSIAGGHHPTVLVDPVVVEEEDDGSLRCIPAEFADRGLRVAFASDECAGTRFLPLHAAYAVRYGLSPADALAALTVWPARAFHLDDRIGSLEKGKDADFVVFSGSPFEPSSRVLLVACNGTVVVDNREDNR